MPCNPLLVEREATHGDFAITAKAAQTLRRLFRPTVDWSQMDVFLIPYAASDRSINAQHREALAQIATKLARILCGDARCADHWRDIAGYANLALEACTEQKKEATIGGCTFSTKV